MQKEISREKIKFINRVFPRRTWDGQNLNVSIPCPNKKCPSHKKNKMKYVFRVDNDVGHCWVCKKSYGSLYYLIKNHNDREEYKGKYMPISYEKAKEEEPKESPKSILGDNFKLLAMHDDAEAEAYKEYLDNRGIKRSDHWFYKLGYTPDMPSRLIFPSFDAQGQINYFIGRSIIPKAYIPYRVPPIKHQNIIINECNINWNEPLILTEGIFDVMILGPEENATPLLGSSISKTSRLFQKIGDMKTSIILALDLDMLKQQGSIAQFLSSYNMEVHILPMKIKYDNKIIKFDDLGSIPKDIIPLLKENIFKFNNKISYFQTLK